MNKKTRCLVLLLFAALLVGSMLFLIAQIHEIFVGFKRGLELTVPYVDKTALFEIVSANRDILLEDIEQNDYSRTKQLFAAHEELDIIPENECVTFDCGGFGFGPETSYWGFYYTPWDGPAAVNGIEEPYASYFIADGPELIDYLTPEDDGLAWHERSVNPRGDNIYYTERICEGFWYYRLDY